MELAQIEPFWSLSRIGRHRSNRNYWHGSNRNAWHNASEISGTIRTEIAMQSYRSRWDKEVFIRFIKQELHVNDLVSLNENGIEVRLYMTMIMAMLVLIYKNVNKIGYKTAKRRFKMELRNIAIAIIIIQCEGKIQKFKT